MANSLLYRAAMTEPESSRSRPEGTYDVFMSFRGEDTRKTFTDHLYAALVKAGIHTFQDDDEIPRGEEISEHLLRAIRESKISIVVFSKGYGSSRWCLDELVEILKCKRKKTGQIVLPIFYDIDPSDVRKQTGSFAEAFVKHEECFEEKLVKEWRKALEDAGNLSGWNLNDMANGTEAEFVKEIIKFVLTKLEPKYLDVPEHLVGMDRLALDIYDFLSTATDDVRIVGIHGMPGIGKTTIAKVVFNQLCYGFEGSCFLSDINERSKQFNGLAFLQKQLLHDILKQDVANFDCVDRGKVLIKDGLCRKRVLVVADDVARQDQLNALMGERSWFGPGSRLIITTRDSNLLREADQTYRIEELEPDEALQLFSWHAFKDTKPAKDYIELSKKAVDYCGGLPFALEVIGALLYRKNRGEWESEIDNLSRIPNQDIQGKLLTSYHALDGELQRAFLDIACFFINGIEKEYVAKVLGARYGYNPEVVLETLHERSMIKVLGETVTMHDLFRDMGREVVRESSPKEPGKRTRNWNQEDAWNVLEQLKEISGWILLITNLILEIASAVFDQMGYALIGMVLAFVALLLAAVELIHMARKERTKREGMSLLPRFHLHATYTFATRKPVGTIVEYFGLAGAVWQCVYSTVEYMYTRQKKDNPIKMCLLPFIFLLCVVISKLIISRQEFRCK